MTTHDIPVKMVELAHPRADISAQEFHDHWRHPHATLVRDIRPIRHYVQNHRIASDLVPETESPYLGIAEVWFDSAASGADLVNDPQYVTHVGPDEPAFVDQSKLVVTLTTEEVVQTNRGQIAPNAPAGDLYWSDKDAPTYTTLWQFVRDRSVDWSSEESLELSRRLGAFRHVVNRSIQPDSEIAIVRRLSWPSLTVFEQACTAYPRPSPRCARSPTRSCSSPVPSASSRNRQHDLTGTTALITGGDQRNRQSRRATARRPRRHTHRAWPAAGNRAGVASRLPRRSLPHHRTTRRRAGPDREHRLRDTSLATRNPTTCAGGGENGTRRRYQRTNCGCTTDAAHPQFVWWLSRT